MLRAGEKIDRSPYNGGGNGNTGFDVVGNAVLDWHNNVRWNPLTNDGDALRLAVKMRMDVTIGQSVKVVAVSEDGENVDRIVLPLGDDPLSATRRAIVRAAVEIGKAMP